MINFEQWEGFEGRIWKEEVNVRDFIQKNYTPYDGDESFLAGPTEATNKLWGALQKLQKEERAKGGVLDMETEVVSSLTAYGQMTNLPDINSFFDRLLQRKEQTYNTAVTHRLLTAGTVLCAAASVAASLVPPLLLK